MTTETLNTVLLFLGAVVAAVLFVADRQGKRLNESIPADILPLFMGLLALAKELAQTTATTEDDELITRIEAALRGDVPVLPDAPVDPEAVG